jgi:hypothetical protein
LVWLKYDFFSKPYINFALYALAIVWFWLFLILQFLKFSICDKRNDYALGVSLTLPRQGDIVAESPNESSQPLNIEIGIECDRLQIGFLLIYSLQVGQ